MSHVIKMIGYVGNLEKLGSKLDNDLATDMILQSLPASFEPFIMNFYMNGIKKTLAELHGMLKTAEESLKKNPSYVMMVQKESKRESVTERLKLQMRSRALSLIWLKSPSQALLALTLATTAISLAIGGGIASSIWKNKRKRRKV